MGTMEVNCHGAFPKIIKIWADNMKLVEIAIDKKGSKRVSMFCENANDFYAMVKHTGQWHNNVWVKVDGKVFNYERRDDALEALDKWHTSATLASMKRELAHVETELREKKREIEL